MTFKKHIPTTILLGLLSLYSSLLHAQLQPVSYVKNKIDGLQSNTVYYLHTAKNGLLYIGHSKGLSSFDGNCFKNFYNKQVPFTGMSNILETQNGTIFCKAFNNNLFCVQGDSLKNIKFLPTQNGYNPSYVLGNTVLSYSNDSIYFYDANTKKETARNVNNATLSTQVKQIVFANYVRFKDDYGLLLIDKKMNLYREKDTSISGQIFLDNGELFIAKEKSLKYLFHYNSFKTLSIEPSMDKSIINYVRKRNGIYWICTTNGLYKAINEKISNNVLFKNTNISCLDVTAENNFALSSINDGLLFFSNHSVNKLPNLPEGISTINLKNNNLLIGTKYGEVYEYNIKNHKSTLILKSDEVKSIDFLLYDSIHHVTIATTNKTYVDYGNKKHTDVFIVKDYALIEGTLLLSSNLGIFMIDNGSKKTWLHEYIDNDYKVQIPLFKKLTLFDEPVPSIKYDGGNKTIYFNSYAGVLELKEGYSKPKLLPDPWCVLSDMCVFENKFLLATKDNGIIEWNKKDSIKDNPTFRLKNSPNGIFNAFEIYKNELWILADDALYCYQNGQFTKYDNSLGFNIDKIINFKIDDKNIYANIGNAIVTFPKNINLNATSSASFLINSIKTKNNTLVSNNSILDYNNNSLTINFSLIAFANASNTHLAYSINHEDTIHLSNFTRDIYLNNVTPDNYTIYFFCMANDKIVPGKTQQISFSITPPFYKTWWFNSIILLSCILLAYFIFKSILNKWKKDTLLKESKLMLEKELDKSMLTSIKAQMNPHFLFNALNTIQSYIYSNDKQNASIYISKFSDLTRSILDMSTKETIFLEEEINSLRLYLELEKMRFEDSFNYQIIVSSNLNKEQTKIPSMLVQPYIENAIKHGLLHKKTNRELTLNFEKENTYLIITIDDNGIGRKKSEELNKIKNRQHHSFAMNANKKRIDILKNTYKEIDLQIIDKYSDLGEPSGTKVIIKLPL